MNKLLIMAVTFHLLLFSGCQKDIDSQIVKQYLLTHQQYLEQKDKTFRQLVFTLSDFQFKKTRNLKIILDDQLGRKWLFKFGNASKDGAQAIYKLYSLVGMKTPEIHVKEININNKPQLGTLQPFWQNIGTLDSIAFQELNQANLNYLAQSHMMSWVAANSHIHPRQFIVLANDDRTNDGIASIDNSVEWFLVGKDDYGIDYRNPTLYDVPSAGYSEYWRMYLRGFYNIDFRAPLLMAKILEVIPDSSFRSFFRPGIDNGYFDLQNIRRDSGDNYEMFPDLFASANKDFLEILVVRKNQAVDTFRKFYKNLIATRKASSKMNEIDDTLDVSDLIKHRTKELTREIELSRVEMEKLKSINATQAPIRAVLSVEASNVLKKLFAAELFGRKEILKELQDVQNELTSLLERTQHPLEKLAVKQALKASRKVTTGDHYLNRLRLKKKLQNINEVFTIIPKYKRKDHKE